jgi:hypothetical protein
VHLTQQAERTGREQNWFALTGRVVAVKVEADGDVHIELSDATGDKQGIVVVEIPLGPLWCDIRTTVFSWTPTRFPFQTRSTKRLKVIQTANHYRNWQTVLGHRPCAERPKQPAQVHAGLCCLGDSSGDETDRSALIDKPSLAQLQCFPANCPL